MNTCYGVTLDLQRLVKTSHSDVIDERLSKGHLGLHIHGIDRLVSCFEKTIILFPAPFPG